MDTYLNNVDDDDIIIIIKYSKTPFNDVLINAVQYYAVIEIFRNCFDSEFMIGVCSVLAISLYFANKHLFFFFFFA